MSQITKRALEQSLKNLLLKKPLTKITINDIAEDCGINRMTFYRTVSPPLGNALLRLSLYSAGERQSYEGDFSWRCDGAG